MNEPVLGGVCTAGNSSTENDGAAAVVVTSKAKALAWGLEPMASIRSFSVVGDDPRRTYKTVPLAVEKALRRAGSKLDQMDLIEIQEAFAAQVLADLKGMGLGPADYDRINVNGSGISLGHPIACTGTRVLVTLLYEMKRRRERHLHQAGIDADPDLFEHMDRAMGIHLKKYRGKPEFDEAFFRIT